MIVHTIGHSNHPAGKLQKLVAENGVQLVIDVRSKPGSRWVRHVTKNALESLFGEAGVDYLWMGDSLGGKPDDRALYDPATGMPDYAKMATQTAFRDGVTALLSNAAERRVCIMCMEEDPTRCHRHLLVGKALRQAGAATRHIRSDGSIQTGDDFMVKSVKRSERNA